MLGKQDDGTGLCFSDTIAVIILFLECRNKDMNIGTNHPFAQRKIPTIIQHIIHLAWFLLLFRLVRLQVDYIESLSPDAWHNSSEDVMFYGLFMLSFLFFYTVMLIVTSSMMPRMLPLTLSRKKKIYISGRFFLGIAAMLFSFIVLEFFKNGWVTMSTFLVLYIVACILDLVLTHSLLGETLRERVRYVGVKTHIFKRNISRTPPMYIPWKDILKLVALTVAASTFSVTNVWGSARAQGRKNGGSSRRGGSFGGGRSGGGGASGKW